MALRPTSSGTISFGLVSIPVKLFTTTESSKTVRFNNVHKSCGTRVKNRYYCPTDDRLVERDELAKGYEFAKGQFVLFSKDELKAITPDPTNTIEITEFVPAEKVDPIYFEKSTYLGPDKGGAKPYRLLSEAMRRSNRAALARYAARGKNYLVLLRPFQDGLLMQQLHYADEVRDFSEVPIGEAEVKDQEIELALQLVDQIASDEFHPENYEDDVRNRTVEMIERKVQGEEIVAPPEEAPKAQIIDLMAALKASLDAGTEEEGESKSEASGDEEPKKRAAGGS